MALVISLLFLVILFGFSGALMLKVFHETKWTRISILQNQALYAGWGGGRAGLDQLDVLINDYLLNTIVASNPSGVTSLAKSRVASGDGISWLVYSVRNNNVPVLTQNGEQAEFSGSGTLGNATYQYTIIITEKSDPFLVAQDVWDFPFYYKINTKGASSGVPAQTSVDGDFTVRVQKDNFAKYALFTNSQTTQSGTNVWFTSFTNFSGPVHTNQRFNFANNPSGTFEDLASEYQQTARFYNNGSSILLDAAFNGTRDVPVFNGGFDRGVNQVTFTPATEAQDMADQATGNQTLSTPGIYVPNSGGALTGGIYVQGNANVSMAVDGSNNPVYTVTQGATTKTITIDQVAQQTTVATGASSQTYTGLPDGMDDVGILVYVEGSIDSFSGIVQSDTQVTVASKSNFEITNNVTYQNYTPAVGTPGQAGYVPPSASGTENLLGIVSWAGSVKIGTAAPSNVQVHGTVLAMSGVFEVENYSSQAVGPRGTATLLGGVIQNNYGAFGTFNGSTGQQVSGYGRNFVYDQRMQEGYAPPYFPSLSTFIAFTNDIADKTVWREGQ